MLQTLALCWLKSGHLCPQPLGKVFCQWLGFPLDPNDLSTKPTERSTAAEVIECSYYTQLDYLEDYAKIENRQTRHGILKDLLQWATNKELSKDILNQIREAIHRKDTLRV